MSRHGIAEIDTHGDNSWTTCTQCLWFGRQAIEGVRKAKPKNKMKRKTLILPLLAASLAYAASASASITVTLGDTSTFAGNPSGVWGITVPGYNGGNDFVAGEQVGLYELIGADIPGGPNVWGLCISPSGFVDYNPHTYDVLTFANPNAIALNSPAWAPGGLLTAAQIVNIYQSQVIASGSKLQAWGLTAAIYDVLFDNSTVTFVNSVDGLAVQGFYNSFLQNLSGNPIGYLLRPNPLDQIHAQQEFLIPVPEPTTLIAGALLLLPFGASTLRVLRRRIA